MPSLFSVPIEGPSLAALIAQVEQTVTPLWLITLNPEMLVAAHHDPSYAAVLRQADIRTVDGFGLWLILRLRGYKTERVTGVMLSEALLTMAARHDWKVGCFGGRGDDVDALRERIRAKIPHLSLHIEAGGRVDEEGMMDTTSEEAWHRMQLFAPDILLVSFGGGTKQERWIARQMSDVPRLRVVVGIGGVFNYWTGRMRPAPPWIRTIGLEWLWRVIQEPTRLRRIFRAVIVFPWLCVWSFLHPSPYDLSADGQEERGRPRRSRTTWQG